ncbi:hypothetical protein [Billgrantia gudaonensis]|uniref:Cell division protein ZipA n=1 Tax=Billgrantia gudaonensis TaxID=376427 RepID=A0A1G9DDT2_9GAMM|nr:hypothetical protein [Halomonas gudaonensis]SDK61989.1 hypothetical protein SAMN04487954_12123 [Halomonas gudaonensis]
MNSTNGAILLAGVAIALGLIALGIFLYVRRAQPDEEPRASAPEPSPSGPEPQAPEPAAAANVEASEPAAEEVSHRFQVVRGDGVQQCLFVVFDWPALDTNRRLNKVLEEEGAIFDTKQGVYTIRDGRAGYRLTVADSTPPGRLPPLHEEGEHPIVGGISILVHFRNKKRVAQSPETLIRLTQSVAAIGGKILDAERNEVSAEDFERLRQGH